MKIRIWHAAVAGAVVAVLVTGCAGVPTGGRVSSGRSADRAELVDDPYVRIVPVGPGHNWDSSAIVDGFVTASASFDDGHRVARQYLLGPRTLWRPEPRPAVTIYQGSLARPETVKQTASHATVRVHGTQLGTIGSDGQYEAEARNIEMIFQLARSAQGQWRIERLPAELVNGLLLSRRDVERAFRTLNLYFFAPDGQRVVPNAIFLPLINRRELAGQLVQALLGGPTDWLGPAVRNRFPAGTRLLGGVEVSDGTATVNLSKEARAGDTGEMSSQLMWTLRQLPEVQRLKLQIDGTTQSPHGGSTQTIDDWKGNSPDATYEGPETAVFRGPGDHLHRINIDRLPQRVINGENDRLHSPATSPGLKDIAGLDSERHELLAAQLNPGATLPRAVLHVRERGARFTAPSWDRFRTLWVVESTRERSWLWVRQNVRKPVRVTAWGLGGNGIRALRVARDGVRVAAIVMTGRRAQIQVGRIVRATDGSITSVSFLPVSSELIDAVDLAWSNSGMLAVLGRVRSATQVSPYLVPVGGGPLQPMGVGSLSDPISIGAAPSSPVLIGTRDDAGKNKLCAQRSYSDRFSDWTCSLEGADPAYAG